MAASANDIDATYWKGVFVPVILSMLIFISIFVFLFTNTGKPHALLNKMPLLPQHLGTVR